MSIKPDIHVFNNGKSRVLLNWSPIAQAYYVYREDGLHLNQIPMQGMLRIYNDFDAAKRDYEARVSFIAEMEAAQ